MIASSTGSFASLSFDILNLFLAYFPARWQRLTILSLVCKRWRQAVMLSISSITLPALISAPPVASRCPNVTSLCVRELQGEFEPPPRLRKLSLTSHYRPYFSESRCCLRHFTSLSSLNDLSLALHSQCPYKLPLLNAVCSSLERLKITCTFDSLPYFPALRHLAVHSSHPSASFFYQAADTFVARHAAQLQTLRTFSLPLSADISSLQELVYDGQNGLPTLQPCPKKLALHALDRWQWSNLPLTSITGIHQNLDRHDSVRSSVAAFSHLRNLTSLSLRDDWFHSAWLPILIDLARYPFASTLTRLTLYSPIDATSVCTGMLPSLTSLETNVHILPWQSSLRNLSFSFADVELAMAYITPYLTPGARLRTLELVSRKITKCDVIIQPFMSELFRRCEEAGVEVVELQCVRVSAELRSQYKWLQIRQTL